MYKILVLSILSLALVSGCARNKAIGVQSPNFKASSMSSLYVVHQPKDNRHINVMIKADLVKRGYKVDTGSKEDIPKHIDGLITYIDKWQWDITNYMIELSIFMKNPESEFPIARGYSMHTSLTRLSTEEMVKEVVSNMLGENKKQEKANETNN